MSSKKWIVLGIVAGALALLAVVTVWAGPSEPWSSAEVLGTSFTYQGQLKSGSEPITGTCDFRFALYDDGDAGTQIGSTQERTDVQVTDGLFTISDLDFGSDAFAGEARWLEIAVQCAGDASYVTLGRQQLTAAPYALHARSTGALQGYPVTSTAPISGQLLRWSGAAWEPATLNLPPVAVLQAEPAVLYLGETDVGTATLSLTPSYDPEGGALSYDFDPAGRTMGTPGSYGSSVTTTAVYSDSGDYLAAGWVQDGGGAYDRAQALVSVYRFGSTTPDRSGNMGWYASLAVVQGRPAIAYYDVTNAYLKYVRAGDVVGASWPTPVTVDNIGWVGDYASLAVVQGRPAIAYFDDTYDDLMYLRANDATGSWWPTSAISVTGAGNVGEYASLAVVHSRPAIAYLDNGNDNLMYVRAGDAVGSSWSTPVTVDGTESVGWFASLAVVDGNPAIAYFEWFPDHDLRYVRATDSIGEFWGAPVTVDSTGDVGQYASLAVVDGRPAIAYYDDTNAALKYVRALDTVGSSWGVTLTVDSAGDVGQYASLAVLDGRPAVAYYDVTNADLKYVRANDATGCSWPTPLTVDSAGDVGQYASLAVVDGRPAIAYYDGTYGNLRFTIPRQD